VLALVQEDPPDIAVLNWGMPGTSRATLVRRLRTIIPSLPVVVVSGYDVTAHEIGAANDNDPIPVLAKRLTLRSWSERWRRFAAEPSDRRQPGLIRYPRQPRRAGREAPRQPAPSARHGARSVAG
jgi:CheY-like chemotaxis protein